jgi:DNA replication protein DnaC
MKQEKTPIEISFNNFKYEVEKFFMTKFITGTSLEKKYSECLDIIYNITGTKDTTRGIFAFNEKYGQGKSFFFEVVNHRHRRKYKQNLFKMTTARELCRIYTSSGKGQNPEDQLLEFINCRTLFIDDIGDELKDGKERSHYSNKLNVIRFVLLKRYDLWVSKGWKTFGTTNLTIEQIAQNYDGRVADRLLQMTYFEEFKFLGSGSFRQIEETRKLTPEEIKRSWISLEKKKKVERVDLEKYFNELINEDDSYFEGKDNSFWSFVKDYLIEKSLLTKSDISKIDETTLDASESLLRRDTRETKRMSLKHAPGNVRNTNIDQALSKITRKDIFNTAENIMARRKFIELKKIKHIFK